MAFTTTSATTAGQQNAGHLGLFQRIRNAVLRQQDQARITGELVQMSSRELADLGLSPSDIPSVARGTFKRS